MTKETCPELFNLGNALSAAIETHVNVSQNRGGLNLN